MVSRRNFVCGLGATLASLSMLDLTRVGRALAAPSGAPLRLVLWPSLNGAEPQYFWPGAGNLAAMSVVTEPLKAYQKQITFVKGLKIDGADNHFAVRSMFTGAPVGSYDTPDPAVKSLDQVVRDTIARTAPTHIPSLHLGARPADSIEYYRLYGRSTFFFAPSAVDYEANPVSAFDRAFSSVGGVPPSTSGPDASKLRNAVLALNGAELASVSARLSRSPIELTRLSQHSGALTKLVRDPSVITPTPVTPGELDSSPLASVEKLRPALLGNDRAAYQDALYGDVFNAQVDIMARALVSGATRVATLQAGSADGNVIVPIDAGYPHHNTSHGDQATFARVQQWYATKFLRLLRALDVPDPLDPGGKTVLYNSAIVWLSECLPVGHGSSDVPCLIAGNAGGKLSTGKLISTNGATNKQLLKTLSRVFGASDGDSAHFGNQALSELLS